MSTQGLSSIPPLPGAAEAHQRREQTRRRRRLLSGLWERDLATHMAVHFDPVRRTVIGKPDQSSNLFRSVVQQLSQLYSRPPVVSHEEDDMGLTAAVTDAGWWSMAPRLQRLVLGLREALVRPSVTEHGLMYRIVTPDTVFATAPADNPDQPDMVTEARVRRLDGKDIWTHDVLDIRDPGNPIYKIVQAEKPDHDLTAHYLGQEYSGDAYPYRDGDGNPLLPYVLFHAERTGHLWDGWEGFEMVEGTLTLATLWSYWLHATRDASWPQRYTVDAFLRGTSSSGSDHSEHSAVATDPSSILQFRGDGSGSPTIGQFAPGSDPAVLGKAIADFEARLSVHYDIGPQDFTRSGQAESGYAISLKRESVREAQRKFESQFRRGDLHLLSLSASMLNKANGAGSRYPENGWSINYPGLPRTPQEIEASLDEHEKLIELGLESRVDAFLDLHPGMSREAALDHLITVAAENRRLQVA